MTKLKLTKNDEKDLPATAFKPQQTNRNGNVQVEGNTASLLQGRLKVMGRSTSLAGTSSGLPKRKLLSLNRSIGNRLDSTNKNRHDGITLYDLAVPDFLFKPATTLSQSPPKIKPRKRKRVISTFGGSSKAKKTSKYSRIISTALMRHEIGKFTKETLLHEMNVEPWSVLEWPGINSSTGSKDSLQTKNKDNICKVTKPVSLSDCLLLDRNGFLQNAYKEGWQYTFGPDRPTPVLIWNPIKDYYLGACSSMGIRASRGNSDDFMDTSCNNNANMYKREAFKESVAADSVAGHS